LDCGWLYVLQRRLLRDCCCCGLGEVYSCICIPAFEVDKCLRTRTPSHSHINKRIPTNTRYSSSHRTNYRPHNCRPLSNTRLHPFPILLTPALRRVVPQPKALSFQVCDGAHVVALPFSIFLPEIHIASGRTSQGSSAAVDGLWQAARLFPGSHECILICSLVPSLLLPPTHDRHHGGSGSVSFP
jgi:hypothetical protein